MDAATPQPEMIDNEAALASLCSRLREAGDFAFDTEFVGEDCYEPEVCLIQTASDGFCALVDPVGGLDVKPFWELVADPSIRIIVHAGSEDLALCAQRIGRPAANVVDLQIAAGFIGLGYPTSLSRLAQMAIRVKLHKSQTLTDWRRRPLSREQIDYAVADVIHLPRIARFIEDRLIRLGRQEWAVAESAAACLATRELQAPVARRLRGAGTLTRREWAIVRALTEERDRLAREYNRPARTVLRDHIIAEMARRGWTDAAKLATLRGVSLSRAALERLARAVEAATRLPPSEWPSVETDRQQTPQEEVVIHLLTAVLRDYCRHHQIAYSLLANKRDVGDLVHWHASKDSELPTPSLLTGWRKEAVGALLDSVLAGGKAVRVERSGSEFRLVVE